MVIRARMIPSIVKIDDKQEVRITQLVSEEQVKEALNSFVRYFNYMLSNFTEIDTYAKLNDFLDYLVFSIRASLYIDVDERMLKSVPKKIHLALVRHELSNIEKYVEALYANQDTDIDFPKDLHDLPGDIRPGLNTVSYIVFSQTVSAIACSKYLFNKKRKDEETEKTLATLRLVALFYPFCNLYENAIDEITKSIDPKKGKIIIELISVIQGSAITDSEISAIYNNALEMMAGRELPGYIFSFLGEKSRQIMSEKGVTSSDELRKAFYNMDFWENFTQKELQLISEEYVKGALKLTNDNPIFKKPENYINDGEISVVRFDVKSVQKEIRVNDLRTMIFGSFAVDFCVFVMIPISLIDEGLPAECILYYGGGTTTVIMPSSINGSSCNEIANKIAKVCKQKIWLRVDYGQSPLVSHFPTITSNIDADLTRKKLSSGSPEWNIQVMMNPHMNCKICDSRPATDQIKIGNEVKYVCGVCRFRREEGSDLYFRKRLEAMGLQEEKIGKMLQKILEFIAGDDIENGISAKSKNLAVLRFDANLIGAYMGSSITISDAFERSIVIDRSIKTAYRSFIEILKKAQGLGQSEYRGDVQRVLLGTLYIGGDDATIFLPSRIALFMAVHMINEFYKQMGGIVTLSAGIVAAKPKHPFVQLYEATGFLLDEVSKKNSRQMAYENRVFEVDAKRDFAGALSFYVADGGYVDDLILDSYLKSVYDKMISRQYLSPFVLGKNNQKENILSLLNIISAGLSNQNYNIEHLTTCIQNDIRYLYEHVDYVDNLKSILVNPVRKVLSLSIGDDRSNFSRLIFTLRQGKKREDSAGRVYELLVQTTYTTRKRRSLDVIFPLDDVLQAVKLVIGE
jgi:hypothetical protein